MSGNKANKGKNDLSNIDKNTLENGISDEKRCGVIMPIANTEGYPPGHWNDVREIIYDAINKAGFEPNLVSFDIDVSTIHKRIVQNLYFNPIVVCDISSRNANVMFELGMRLAFDKPTIIIKDDNTPYSFDIAGIEHLNYPHDLRYKSIEEFKDILINKIKNTIDSYNKDPENFSVFLKHFGDFKVPKLDQKEVSIQEIVLDEIKEIKNQIRTLEIKDKNLDSSNSLFPEYTLGVKFENSLKLPLPKEINKKNINELQEKLNSYILTKNNIKHYTIDQYLDGSYALNFAGKFSPASKHQIKISIDQIIDSL
ncbi:MULTISPECIES: hypothetical protein [Providencia]|uniref:hypothetical protein n=1 Tax=Providencia TaxID=586 RepID=UPI0015EC867B|nr:MULTISPECIES: hypothetical protein [Providencia]ELR5138000.1 hypothetical protein [Providencia rettgeri]ELR5168618.1 hypothetical protein [Providencia rettgeri]ELR5224926.1 hypothetical protein [Providencia rettgeri]QLQ92197.1 hypothetical protein H0907_12820 [Providencia rettgeri]WEB82807.1 hypothetical protein LVJ10_12845 [Providencia rettgeri]